MCKIERRLDLILMASELKSPRRSAKLEMEAESWFYDALAKLVTVKTNTKQHRAYVGTITAEAIQISGKILHKSWRHDVSALFGELERKSSRSGRRRLLARNVVLDKDFELITPIFKPGEDLE